MIVDSKVHELIGNLCPHNKAITEMWTEVVTKNGIKISKKCVGI